MVVGVGCVCILFFFFLNIIIGGGEANLFFFLHLYHSFLLLDLYVIMTRIVTVQGLGFLILPFPQFSLASDTHVVLLSPNVLSFTVLRRKKNWGLGQMEWGWTIGYLHGQVIGRAAEILARLLA